MQERKRLVIKVGTKVLSRPDQTLDTEFLKNLTGQVAALRKDGHQVVLVTSGAVGAGKSLLSLTDIASEVVQKQVFAAVGQVKLMTIYSELFGAAGFHCAQVLATKEDFRDDAHYDNMKNCFEGLLLDDVIPVVNENDVVATTELMFTDNDELAGLIAMQLTADALIILTSTNGILDAQGNTVSEVTAANAAQVEEYVSPELSLGGRGGMASKFSVAHSLSRKGIITHILDGRSEQALLRAMRGETLGTRFLAD